MKKMFLICTLFLFACSKSNDKPATPPVVPSVTVKSAAVASGVMSVTVKVVQASQYTKLTLVIYKTDISGPNYKYPILLQDGDQIITCNKFSDASPMNYQIQYGSEYSGMMQLAY